MHIKGPLGALIKWKHNIKFNVRETGCSNGRQMELTQGCIWY
jgi:hypothetical protein